MYDDQTFGLRRLTTTDQTGRTVHQALIYCNITLIKDLAQQTLFFNNAIVSPDQDYTYDALYRLIEAKGRELKGTADFGTTDNWDDSPWKTSHKGDGNAVQTYRQLYTYDEVGNMLSLQHIATVGSYTRSYAYDNNSNQLLSTTVGSHTYNYSHDARGNMDSMAHLSVMNWNRLNELSGITRGTSTANYQYSGGQRVRKWVVKDTITTEERIYLGELKSIVNLKVVL